MNVVKNKFKITPDLEFLEVLNTFPVLKQKLKKFNISTASICEGETIYDYFNKNHLNSDEIRILIRKMNREINLILNEKPFSTTSFTLEEIELEKEEE